MKAIIQMSEADETKALPILLRHSPGIVLPNRIMSSVKKQQRSCAKRACSSPS